MDTSAVVTALEKAPMSHDDAEELASIFMDASGCINLFEVVCSLTATIKFKDIDARMQGNVYCIS
jgi:hypothetical protein